MNRPYRLILVSFSALLFFGVIGVNASASVFEAESYPAHLEGGQESEPLVFETEAGTLECTTVTATGEQEEASESVELALEMTGCKALGFASAGVHLNGCTLRPRGGGSIASHQWNATVDIICPPSKSIVVTAGTCEFDIVEQKEVGGVGLDVETSLFNPAIKFTFNSSMTINVTKDGFLCPFGGTGHKKGTWKGSLRITAWDVIKQIIIKWWLK